MRARASALAEKSEAEFRRLSTAHPDEFFVAEISGALVGYGELESVAVDQQLKGRGIGTVLIGRLLDRFQHIGLRRCANAPKNVEATLPPTLL
jgi:N-acetylglutamate synthase-like GNAT family acetyltransferase